MFIRDKALEDLDSGVGLKKNRMLINLLDQIVPLDKEWYKKYYVDVDGTVKSRDQG